jgi:hypothetical protein
MTTLRYIAQQGRGRSRLQVVQKKGTPEDPYRN